MSKVTKLKPSVVARKCIAVIDEDYDHPKYETLSAVKQIGDSLAKFVYYEVFDAASEQPNEDGLFEAVNRIDTAIEELRKVQSHLMFVATALKENVGA